jgi:DNA polymerase-3 subunit epsilon
MMLEPLPIDSFIGVARRLDAHPDFRVLRRIAPAERLHPGPPQGKTRIGVAVDVETTGLDRETDKIIELAVQRFRFDELGRIIQIATPRVGERTRSAPSTLASLSLPASPTTT